MHGNDARARVHVSLEDKKRTRNASVTTTDGIQAVSNESNRTVRDQQLDMECRQGYMLSMLRTHACMSSVEARSESDKAGILTFRMRHLPARCGKSKHKFGASASYE
jgi:hypothetical protein